MKIDLQGKKGLVIGIANEQSIAYGCAKAFFDAGAELAITYLNDKAKLYVEPLAKQLNSSIFMPCNVEEKQQLFDIFKKIENQWGKLDFLLHSIAYSPLEDLHNKVTNCSREGFLKTLDISCYSFIEMARLAEPIMRDGGSILTISYYGSEKVIKNYNIMGIAKAALESASRYLASDLGERNIRVNTISCSPIMTRAASGIKDFSTIIQNSLNKAFLNHLPTANDIGNLAAFLTSNLANTITGQVIYIDSGISSAE